MAWTGAAIAASSWSACRRAARRGCTLIAFLAMWLLYMSIVNIGQTFYGFGWESLILEAGFLVAFLGSNEVPPPRLVLILTIWLVFRLEFGAGMIKMRGDRCLARPHRAVLPPRDPADAGPAEPVRRTCCRPVHRVEVLGNHFAQLIVPFLLFAPRPVGIAMAAAIVILTQLWLVVTGNFAWLNWITIVLAFAAVGDTAAHALIPAIPLDWGAGTHTPVWFLSLVVAVTVFFVFLS